MYQLRYRAKHLTDCPLHYLVYGVHPTAVRGTNYVADRIIEARVRSPSPNHDGHSPLVRNQHVHTIKLFYGSIGVLE